MAFWLFVSLVIAIVALRRALRAEQVLLEQRRELVDLRRMVQRLADRLGERWPGTAEAPGVEPGVEMPADAAAAAAASASASGGASGGASTGFLPGGEGVPPVPATEAAPTDAAPTEASAAMHAAPPVGAAPVGAAAAATGAASGTATSGAPALGAAATGPVVRDPDALENRIGGRWLLYIGISALVLGASYFLKYAFDNEWIGEETRVIVGLASGVALTILGQRFVRAGHALYGQVLSGGGIGILYLAIFAAHQWYGIVGRPLAFTGMVLTTAVAAGLADRQRSQALALFAVIVGFATPFLIGDTDGGHVTLFTYDAILVAGTLFLARRRAWPALNLMSYVLTVMTIALWADRAYRPSLYLSVELFLTLFLVLFLAMLRENSRAKTPAAMLATMMLALAPVMYHFGSLVNLRPHLGALFVYLILFSVAGIIAAGQLRAPWIRVLVFVGVALPFMGLVDRGFSRAWLAAAWTTTIAVYGAHLLAQIDTLDERRDRLPGPEILLLHANGLWLLFCVQALVAPRTQAWSAPVALGLAAWYGILAYVARTRHREAALHATALASALVAIACTIYFDGPSLVVALGAEGALLVGLALRSSRLWLRLWGGLLLIVALMRALALLAEPAPIAYWPLINPRTLSCLFIVGVLYALAILHARRDAGTLRVAPPPAPADAALGADAGPGTDGGAGADSVTFANAGTGAGAALGAAVDAEAGAAAGFGAGAGAGAGAADAGAGPAAAAGAGARAGAGAKASPPLTRHALIVAANVLTLVILTAEIVTYFDRRAWVGGVERVAGAVADAELARQLTLSIVWALYAVVLIAIGIRRNYRPVRYLAMFVFAFTILKVFIIDLGTLDRVYRMLSVMALGVLLLIASYLYQRIQRAAPVHAPSVDTPGEPQP